MQVWQGGRKGNHAKSWQYDGGLEEKPSRRKKVIQESFIVSEEIKICGLTREAPSDLNVRQRRLLQQ